MYVNLKVFERNVYRIELDICCFWLLLQYHQGTCHTIQRLPIPALFVQVRVLS